MFWEKNKKKTEVRVVEYMRREVAKRYLSRSYCNAVLNASRYLERYEGFLGRKINSKDFDYKTVEGFCLFMKNNYTLKHNTIISIVRKVISSAKKMAREGYEVGAGYSDYKLTDEESTAIALTEEEIEGVYSLKVGKRARVIRDLFVISCETGLRYSDLINLSEENINTKYGTIQRKTQKTGAIVIIPLRRRSREILSRYIPKYNASQGNYNKVVKTLCRKAGIIEKVLVEYTRGDKIVRKSLPRYKLVSSHTGRRTFATSAYLAGVQPARIMMLTGHKTEDSFFKYIRIEKRENAKTLSEHDFFKL